MAERFELYIAGIEIAASPELLDPTSSATGSSEEIAAINAAATLKRQRQALSPTWSSSNPHGRIALGLDRLCKTLLLGTHFGDACCAKSTDQPLYFSHCPSLA